MVSDVPFTSNDLGATLQQAGVSAYNVPGIGGSPTTVQVNRTGRYVRVQLGWGNYLSLAEVQVWGGEPNLAYGKVASQSSTVAGGVASRAVDGNRGGAWGGGSVTHTDYQAHAWWQVDLGSVQQIGEVQVWNRTDCCAERLQNFFVIVSDTPFVSNDLWTTLAQTGVSAYNVPGIGGRPTRVAVNRSARYVRIQLGWANYLSLAEVTVLRR